MIIKKPGEKRLIHKYGQEFLDWIKIENRLICNLEHLSLSIGNFLLTNISGYDEAKAIWASIPAVTEKCDDQETYKLPMAAEAYTWMLRVFEYVL